MPFQKGKPPWNKGKRGLQEAWNKGISLSEEHKRKLSEAHKGQIGWNKGKPNPFLAEYNRTHKKIGRNHPMYGKHHSLQTKEKISKALKGRIPWNKGKKTGFKPWLGKKRLNMTNKNNLNWKGGLPKCADCGKQLSSYINTQCRQCFLKSDRPRQYGINSQLAQLNRKGYTSIEKKVYDELKRRGLLFERQKLIKGKFVVDAYIPSLNLVIEADGDYWHGLEVNIKRDKSRNAYLKTCGYNLLRLTETEINNGEFRRKLP